MKEELAERLEYVEGLCRVMRDNGVHELVVGDVHVAMHVGLAPSASAADSRGDVVPKFTGDTITGDELLYWSAGPAPAKPPRDDLPPGVQIAVGDMPKL